MLSRSATAHPTRHADVEVRRLDIVGDESWLITRVAGRELRVQHEVDQCSPRAWLRVVETDEEVRLRYFRARSRTYSCTLVGYGHWDAERVVRLRAPLGTRRIVAELGPVRTEYIDRSCPWVGQSLSALIAGAPRTELDRLQGLEPRWGFGVHELTWTSAISTALELDDVAARQRIARGIRRDMRRLAYPDACTRQFELPPATSTEPTQYVAGGTFDDAHLIGVDRAGAITWSTRLEGAVAAVDVCPDRTRALVAERIPGEWWESSARLRVGFVDLRTGVVGALTGVRAIPGDEPSSAWVSVACSSGAAARGWIQMSVFDYDSFRDRLWIDEIDAGTARRVTLPAGTRPGALGDGVLISQTSEPVDGSYSEVVPGRLQRTDLRSGQRVTGPLLSAQSYVMDLAPDGRTLVTTHGPIRVWDVSTGIVLRHSFPDPHRGQSQLSGAWNDDGTFVLLDFPISDDDPRSGYRGRFHLVDPTAGTMAPMPGWPRNSNNLVGLAHDGRIFTWNQSGSHEEDAGLRAFDFATNRWDLFAPATDFGEVLFVDAVPPPG